MRACGDADGGGSGAARTALRGKDDGDALAPGRRDRMPADAGRKRNDEIREGRMRKMENQKERAKVSLTYTDESGDTVIREHEGSSAIVMVFSEDGADDASMMAVTGDLSAADLAAALLSLREAGGKKLVDGALVECLERISPVELLVGAMDAEDPSAIENALRTALASEEARGNTLPAVMRGGRREKGAEENDDA